MARIWVEEFQGSGVPFEYWKQIPVLSASAGNLVQKKMMLVAVASFTFRFISADQISECLAYYESKTRPSSMRPTGGMSHWENQRWFEQLPMYLLEEPKREKVVKALRRALAVAEAGALSVRQPASRKGKFRGQSRGQ